MTAVAGLSPQDVQTVRQALAAGRRTRVVFTHQAGQIAGQAGQIVRLTDPEAADDFVVVRFGRDELPFTPAEVAIPPRAPATRRPRAASPAAEPPASADVATEEAVVAQPAEEPTATEPEAALPPPPRAEADPAAIVSPGKPTDDGTPTPGTRRGRRAGTAPTGQESTGMETQDSAVPAARKATRPAKPKGPAGLTVTLAYTEGEWMVGATQGSRALAKPYVIKPAEALKFVALLDVPGVHEAVEQIIASERDQARSQAEKLRAELAEVEARLAELGTP